MKKNLLTLDVALSKEIKYMLKEEHYLPGDKLPSERKLAELFHVQRFFFCTRPAKATDVQSFIKKQESIAFPNEPFDSIGAFSAEQEYNLFR